MWPALQISISYSLTPLLFLFFVLLIWAGTVLYYRRTTPEVRPAVKNVLTCLRAAALTLLLWMLFRPVILLTQHKQLNPRIALLIDESASMTIADRKESRADQAVKFLNSSVFQQIREKATIDWIAFTDTISSIDPIDSLEFQGSSTDITRAIDLSFSRKSELPMRYMILISDGVHNTGSRPENRESWPCPVYTIGVGQSEENPDIILTGIDANEIGYTGQEMQVRVSLRGPGMGGRQVQIKLRNGNEEVASKSVMIPESGLETEQTLYFTPDRAGDILLTVSVEGPDDEFTTRNNRRELIVHVREQKQKILIIAGSPDPDLGLIRRLFEQDEHLELTIRTQRNRNGYYEGNLTESDFKNSDLLVLINLPDTHTAEDEWQKISQFLDSNPLPFLLVISQTAGLSRFEFPPEWPFAPTYSRTSGWVFPKLTPEGMNHPILQNPASNKISDWEQLPPVQAGPGVTVLPGTKILMTGIPENGQQEIPLILSRSTHGRRSVVMVGGQFFRWQMLMWHPEDPKAIFQGFLMNCLNWLTSEDQRPVKIKLTGRLYPAGASIQVRAEVYDEGLRPVQEAHVSLSVRGPESAQFTMRPRDNGYVSEFRMFSKGLYTIIADARLGNREVGRDTASFVITEFQPEFLQIRSQHDVLKKIAEQSGGQFFPVDSTANLPQLLSFDPEHIEHHWQIRVWHQPVFLGFIVFLLAFEWWIRRRKGMI
jgi:hypothetical protein